MGLVYGGNLMYWNILWMGIDAGYRGVWLEIGTMECIQVLWYCLIHGLNNNDEPHWKIWKKVAKK